jgi:hypothetical protein
MDRHDLSQAAQAPRVPEAALRSPAMCALHADTPAVATCTRCGDSACAACLQVTSGSALCRACQQRAMQRRLDLLGAERLVRALGITIIVVSLFWLCMGVVAVAFATTSPQGEGILVTWAPVLPIAPAFLVYGIALARARTSLRWPAQLASIGMLMLIPVGTLLGIASLAVLTTARVRTVFSKEHLSIIRITPQVKLGSNFTLLAVAAVAVWLVELVTGFALIYFLVLSNEAQPIAPNQVSDQDRIYMPE